MTASKLVDMLDGASDGACLAVLNRLDALPVPIKDIIKLVAKKLARVRKHETRAVADAASALISQVVRALQQHGAAGLAESAQGYPGGRRPHARKSPCRAGSRQPRKTPVPKPPLQRVRPSVSFEDDEILRKAARQLRKAA